MIHIKKIFIEKKKEYQEGGSVCIRTEGEGL